MSKNFYITSPIYYVNDAPHIGHAYTNLACDVIAKYKTLKGFNVKFLTGTDEHGQKVEKSAQRVGLEPKEFCDNVSQRFVDLAKFMELSNNDFIRTTELRHKKAVIAFWQELKKAGHIYLGTYAGWYSIRDEAYYSESELTENGLAPTGAPVEWVEEPSYFFALSKWQQPLLDFYLQNPDFVFPKTRFNEVINFVKSGLTDISISRKSFKWGIPVPGDEEHVIYVWLDALTNYISALGYPNVDTDDFQKFWPVDMHVLGKDISRFHAIYWPAFLMAAGIALPKRIVTHGWWTNEGEKISKSLGNVIDPFELINKYGLDQTRYFLMREVVFGSDSDFSDNAIITRINSELSNTIGNLCQRTLKMVQQYFGGRRPSVNIEVIKNEEIILIIQKIVDNYHNDMNELRINSALENIVELARMANIFIEDKAPWQLAKISDKDNLNKVLCVLLEVIRVIGLLLLPFIPNSANKLLDQILVSQELRKFSYLGLEHLLNDDVVLPVPEVIFPRYQV